MDGRQTIVVVLLAAAGLVVVLSAVGLLAAGDRLPRLHFVTPVTSIAAPLTGAAYAVQLGWGIAAGLAVTIVLLLAVTGPVLGASIARVVAGDLGILPEENDP
jgi:multicomponent Na+:H+ antiporter subunit G